VSDHRVPDSISQFFGAYFHQDWDIVAEDWTGVVEDYATDSTAAHLRNLAHDIDAFRASRDEAALAVSMSTYVHCAYNPRPLTYQEWLRQIADQLRLHAGARRDGSISKALKTFFGAYFHQDWDIAADDWQGVVDVYVDQDPDAGQLRALADEIDDLCASRPEPDLSHFVAHTAGCDYWPGPTSYRDWLGEVAHRLRQHADGIARNAAVQNTSEHT
jgi:hypothetical protein